MRKTARRFATRASSVDKDGRVLQLWYTWYKHCKLVGHPPLSSWQTHTRAHSPAHAQLEEKGKGKLELNSENNVKTRFTQMNSPLQANSKKRGTCDASELPKPPTRASHTPYCNPWHAMPDRTVQASSLHSSKDLTISQSEFFTSNFIRRFDR